MEPIGDLQLPLSPASAVRPLATKRSPPSENCLACPLVLPRHRGPRRTVEQGRGRAERRNEIDDVTWMLDLVRDRQVHTVLAAPILEGLRRRGRHTPDRR